MCLSFNERLMIIIFLSWSVDCKTVYKNVLYFFKFFFFAWFFALLFSKYYLHVSENEKNRHRSRTMNRLRESFRSRVNIAFKRTDIVTIDDWNIFRSQMSRYFPSLNMISIRSAPVCQKMVDLIRACTYEYIHIYIYNIVTDADV